MHGAAFYGYKEVAELLLANQADVNARDHFEGETPLHLAVSNGHKEVAEFLLSAKADVNASRPSMPEVLRMLGGTKWTDIQAERAQRRGLAVAFVITCLVVIGVTIKAKVR